MTGKPISYIIHSQSRPHYYSNEGRISLTFLDGDRPNIANVIVHAHQLGSLKFPKGFNISIGKTAKKLEPPGKELSLKWIIEIAGTFAGISLFGVVDRKRLVLDVGDSTNFTLALIENLYETDTKISKDTNVNVLREFHT